MLILSIIYLLLSNAITIRRDLSLYYSRSLMLISLTNFLLGLFSLNYASINKGLGLFGGLFNTTITSNTFHIFIFLLCFIILQLTSFYPRKVWTNEYINIYNLINIKLIYNTKISNKMAEQFKIIEYPLIILFIITGAVFLISSNDIVSIFLSIELQSYGLYLLCTLYRNSELSTLAGLIYFLLGGLSSCLILLGTSLLYTNSGTTSLDSFYVISSLSDIKDNIFNIIFWYSNDYINFSLLIISVGFLFKISAAPFHFWSPDVYDAIPTIVTTFVANIAKISIFILLLEIVHHTSNYYSTLNFNWTIGLLLSSLLSLLIGTILGLNQFKIKRLLAYSTISHLGFMLLALAVHNIESIQALIFYLMQYSLSNVNAFIILISIGYSLYLYSNKDKEYEKLLEKDYSPIQLINQMKGYFYINPYIAISLAIVIYSFVGIPPLVGFFGKQMVLSSALNSGYVFITLIAILTSVISAVYYLNVIKQIFFYKSDYLFNKDLIGKQLDILITNKLSNKRLKTDVKNIVLSTSLSLSMSTLTLVILLFITSPQEWLSMANILAILIFN